MALLTDQEVQLRISARAEGGAGVDALTTSVDDLQKELDAVGESAKKSGAAQAAAAAKLAVAKARTDEVKLSLISAKNEYKYLAERAKESGAAQSIFADQAARAKDRIAALNSDLVVARGSVKLASDEHRNAARAVSAHANEQRRLAENLRTVNGESDRNSQANRKISDSVRSISDQLTQVKTLYAAWLGLQATAGAVTGVVQTADAYANLTTRVKMAVGEGEAFQAVFQGIQDIAMRTNSSLDSTGNLFVKLADAGKQMGLGQADALRLTETVNQAIQLSGASALASDAAITQLIQGLQGGVLRGDEFNSIMEQSPRLARALADGLGVTTGELRKMAEAGQLSSEVVINALRGQAAAVEGEFGKLPLTIGRAITDLDTQWQVWLGTLDQSTGASRSAAGAIEALAKNFDLVASGLINAGQAYLGWKAYNIAAEFLGLRTAVAASAAAKAADTAATVANTAATGANTAAQIANNAAKTGAAGAANTAAAGAGRLAGALSLLKGFSLAFLVTNLVDIGTWLGETTAKAMGADKGLKDLERQMKATENAARAVAAENAALAQQTQIAADKALGLSDRAKQLVGDFGELTKGGKSSAEALAQVGKSLDLSDIKGVAEAGATLDALAVKGKISADQVRVAWQQALVGQDLQKFEVQALAAFDGSEQGARRLAAALDAQVGEALRRTGLDAGALSAGVNTAAQSAINDFDVLAGRVDDLKARGVDVGIALSASLDQAGKAATTEAAAKALTERWEEMGKAGLISGDRLADGLRKARAAADDLTPGVNSLAEAFKTLGLKSPEELKKTATAAEQAFNVIKEKSGFTRAELANVQEAFKRYAEAAIAANGGVATDTLRVQAELRGLQVVTDETGKSIVKAMEQGSEATNGLAQSADDAAKSYEKISEAAEGAADAATRAASEVRDAAAKPSGQFSPSASSSIDFRKLALGRGATADNADAVAAEAARLFNEDLSARSRPGAVINAKALISNAVDAAVLQVLRQAQAGSAAAAEAPAKPAPALSARIAEPPAQTVRTVTVNVNLGGQSTRINVASDADASALTGFLRQLEAAGMRAAR